MCSPKSTLNAAILSLSQSLSSPLVVGAQVDVVVSVTVNTDQSGSLVGVGKGPAVVPAQAITISAGGRHSN